MSLAPLFLLLYAVLLRLYPPGFKAEFAAEMRAVFAAALDGAASRGQAAVTLLFLRELVGFASGCTREYVEIFRRLILRRGGSMTTMMPPQDSPDTPQAPSSWAATLAGTLIFLLFGIAPILGELPVQWFGGNFPDWYLPLMNAAYLLVFLVAMLGFGVGWVRSFPRWSYPYTFIALVWSLYMTGVATPALRLFGHTFTSRELWGLRSFIPLVVVSLLALAITRSFKPLKRFITNTRDDWTLLTFGLFGIVSFLAMGFDEMHGLIPFVFITAIFLVITLTALAYMRGTTLRRRAWTVLSGTLLVIVLTWLGPYLYWGSDGVWTIGYLIWTAFILLILFSPGIVRWLRRAPVPR